MFVGTSEVDGCTPTARVRIHTDDGTVEVPWVNNTDGDGGIETRMRKTGPSNLTCFSTAHIPFEWHGDDVLGAVSTSTDNDVRAVTGPVSIDVYSETQNGYVTVHHGPVGNVGPSNVRGCFAINVTDWANVLETIGADVQFKSPSLQDVAETVTQRAQAHQQIDELGYVFGAGVENSGSADVIPASGLGTRRGTGTSEGFVFSAVSEVLGSLANVSGLSDSPDSDITPPSVDKEKSFSQYQHALTDVLDWACESLGIRWYVDYDVQRDGPAIFFERTAVGTFDGINLNGTRERPADIPIITNNALTQTTAPHTLGVRSNTFLAQNEQTSGENRVLSPIPNRTSTDTFTARQEVVVEHDILSQLVGQNFSPRFEMVDTQSRAATINTAKSMLKERIDGAAGGEILTLPHAFVRPYATIDVKPTCPTNAQADIAPLSYEIEEVIHDLAAPTQSPDNEGARTILRCGIRCDIDEDISVRSVETVRD